LYTPPFTLERQKRLDLPVGVAAPSARAHLCSSLELSTRHGTLTSHGWSLPRRGRGPGSRSRPLCGQWACVCEEGTGCGHELERSAKIISTLRQRCLCNIYASAVTSVRIYVRGSPRARVGITTGRTSQEHPSSARTDCQYKCIRVCNGDRDFSCYRASPRHPKQAATQPTECLTIPVPRSQQYRYPPQDVLSSLPGILEYSPWPPAPRCVPKIRLAHAITPAPRRHTRQAGPTDRRRTVAPRHRANAPLPANPY
jgi:hypothetical protein